MTRNNPDRQAPAGWSRRDLMAASLGLLAPLPAVASPDWAERRDFGNRYEGRLNVLYGRAGLEFLSFTRGDIAFQPGRTADLYVHFYLPADTPVQLIAHELNPTSFYRMEAKPQRWQVDRWNHFGPWQTAPVLAPLALDGSKVGVLVWLGDPANHRLAPALVTPGVAPETAAAADYVVQLRSGHSIAECGWSLTSLADPTFRRQGRGGDHVEGESFPLRLPTAGLPPGELRLTVSARWRSSKDRSTDEYRFFHARPAGNGP